MNDFRNIAHAAVGNAESLVACWLPDGRQCGHEWVARNPTRADGKPGSFKVNLTTGKWSDFATGDKGGDLISLLAYLNGTVQGEAARALAGDLSVPTMARSRGRHSAGERTIPVARVAIQEKISIPTTEPKFLHWKHGEPSVIWSYQNARGNGIGYACRFDLQDDKEVLPLAWVGGKWQWKAMPEPRPLYNLPDILSRPDAIICIVEGEKAADAATELLPEAVTTTWAGGCKAWDRTDWTPLKDRRAILWPDADAPGRETMDNVRQLLLKIGTARVKLVTLPDGLPKGWDAADALTEGWTHAEALKLLAERVRAPSGLCPLCWRNHVAAPIGGPTCQHSQYVWPKWPEELAETEMITA